METGATDPAPNGPDPIRGTAPRAGPLTRWAPKSVCLSGVLERHSPAKDMLREGCERLAKNAAFRTTASAAHQCATYPGFLFPKGTPESGASTKGRLGAARCRSRGTLRGPRDAQWERARFTVPELGRHGLFSLLKLVCTRTSHGLMGVDLLALFSLNNSNSPNSQGNSQGNPLHSGPCKLRLTHTLKLYM